MSTTPTIEYDKFSALGGLDLCHYMEPLLGNPATTVSKDVLGRMLSELPTYDEYHLIYALTVGVKHSPETFAMQLPRYLTHESGPVRCTAMNSLAQLPDEDVTETLVDVVRQVQSGNPTNPWVSDGLATLQRRFAGKTR